MNISQAIFYNELSPDIICKDLYNIIKGFEEVEEQNNRRVNFTTYLFYLHFITINQHWKNLKMLNIINTLHSN